MTNKLFDYSSFPTLSTTRLILRQVRLTDAAGVLLRDEFNDTTIYPEELRG